MMIFHRSLIREFSLVAISVVGVLLVILLTRLLILLLGRAASGDVLPEAVLGLIAFGILNYLPLLLGTIAVADPDQARVAGFFIHLVNGQLFALGYALVFALLDEASWWLGGLLGLLHGTLALLVLVPLLPGVHPRMASERAAGWSG